MESTVWYNKRQQEERIVTTPVNDLQDIIRALENNPDLREQLRALLLTKDLLELPAKFAALVEAIRENNETVNRRLDSLEQGQARLEESHTQLQGQVNRLETRFGNFEGQDYEWRCTARMPAQAQIWLGIENPNVAFSQDGSVHPAFNRALSQALQASRITPAESEDILNADIIIYGTNRRHAVVETSLNADGDDITRARRRAELLGRITGDESIPAVATQAPTPGFAAQCEAEGVNVITVPYRIRRGIETPGE